MLRCSALCSDYAFWTWMIHKLWLYNPPQGFVDQSSSLTIVQNISLERFHQHKKTKTSRWRRFARTWWETTKGKHNVNGTPVLGSPYSWYLPPNQWLISPMISHSLSVVNHCWLVNNPRGPHPSLLCGCPELPGDQANCSHLRREPPSCLMLQNGS